VTPVFFAFLLWGGLFITAGSCVIEARDGGGRLDTLLMLMIGLAAVTWAFTGALY
jgi:hypothetical protein